VDDTIAALISVVPLALDRELRIVDLGSGDGMLADALLARFERATLLALAGSESDRAITAERIAHFGARAKVRLFDIAALDWWDLMMGADLVVSSRSVHRLNDAKKQYLYKAAAERLSPGGALLIADRVQAQHPHASAPAPGTHPSALFHQLVWLRHAGFAAVDCFRLLDGVAVFGGFKQVEASAPPPPADN
jgi:trans-aconitate methyltransferase